MTIPNSQRIFPSGLAIFLMLILPVLGSTAFAASPAVQGDEEKKAEAETEPQEEGQPQEEKQQEVDDAPPAKSALLEPKRKLTEKQKKDFEPTLRTFLNDPRDLNAQKALDDQLVAFEVKEEFSPLCDVETWRSLFEDHFYESIRKNRVNGAGRVQEETALLEVKGELYAFEYAYIIPRSYDHEKRWPILLCLHDEGSNGKTYLQKLWQSSKEDKDLCENFILIAPDLREKTLEKKFREGRSVEERIEWFDNTFLRAILQPFNEIRRQFHCDPENIYIEGVGTGAEAAVQLASLLPGRFAGVISRHGGMRDPKALPSLEGTKFLFLGRTESEHMTAGSPAAQLLDHLKAEQEKNPAFEVVVREAPAEKRLSNKAMGGQDTDPLMDLNANVAEFIAKTKLDPYPQTFHIVCGRKGFKSHPLAKITSHEVTDEDYLDFRLTFDREKNRIVVKSKAVFKFTVFLNDLILDLDKPIEVVVNGVTLENRTVQRDPSQLIRDLVGKPLDYHQVLPAYIVVEIPDEPVKEAGETKAGETEEKQKSEMPKSSLPEPAKPGAGERK